MNTEFTNVAITDDNASRCVEIKRTTAETDIQLTLNLDGEGNSEIKTGCGFLDHMLILFARHGRFDIQIACQGDTRVDYHHTAEDIGISLGQAFRQALGDKKGIYRYADTTSLVLEATAEIERDKKGIYRYADTTLPMDEALILTAVDISGRGGCYYETEVLNEKVGDFDTELVEEFWLAFTRESGITLHIRQLAGKNTHHILEGIFKSAARSLGHAVSINQRFADEIPSTKGTL